MNSGIYIIRNVINGKIYVGSTINFTKRWQDHRRFLSAGGHHSNHLQNSWDFYGEENFIFEIIEEVGSDQLLLREQYYLDTLLFAQEYIRRNNFKFIELGYNMNPTAGNCLGKKCRKETKEKLSRLNSGKNHPQWGIPKSEKTKNIIRLGKLGNKNPMFGSGNSVLQYDLIGNFIRKWSSAGEASQSLNFHRRHIHQCCEGKRKTHKKYTWKYESN